MHINNTLYYFKSSYLKEMALLLSLLCQFSMAQLVVNNSYSVQSLVEDVLVGSGVYVSNVTFTGKSVAVGYFNGQNTNLGIDSGIVLSTGDVTKIAASSSTFISTSNNTSGDVDLEAQIPGSASQSKDAAVIEFDFYTFSNTVKFKYVFGSEEYPNYVCTNYNDAFGFFISGPGIVGNQNVALIPGTSTIVSINNVNGGGTSCPSNSTYFVDNAAQMGNTIAFNGFTTVLEAVCTIQPCQIYHVKLAIADVYDGSYDSGVFLEARSLNSSIQIISEPSVKTPLPDSSLYENCGYSVLSFVKMDSSSSNETFYLSYGGSAVNGADYVTLPDSIDFAPGQDTAYLYLVPINDAFSEGTETIDITVSGGACSSALGELSLTILDLPSMNLSLSNDTSIKCPSDSIVLSATATGVGSISYLWENGDTLSSIFVSAMQSDVFTVEATDVCGATIKDSVSVTISNYTSMTVLLPNDTNICPGQSIWIKANVNGGKQEYTFAWEGLTNSEDSVLASTDSIQTYIVFVTDSCGITASDTTQLTALGFVPSFAYNFVSNYEVNFSSLSTAGTVLSWDFGTGDTSNAQSPNYTYEPGEYTVQMIFENQLGCIDTVYQLVVVNPEFNAFVPNAFTPDGDDLNDVFSAKVSVFKEYHMQVFDRWGRLLFQSDDSNKGWDGKDAKGESCPQGVYPYSFQFVDNEGNYLTKMGTVLLMR